MNKQNQKQQRTEIMVAVTTLCPEEYLLWLMDVLFNNFKIPFSNVKYIPIHELNQHSWESEVKNCPLVIVYHSKHERGVNINKLYRKELHCLSKNPGKEKVLVVLDDMEDTKEETQIISNLTQHSFHLICIPKNGKKRAAAVNRELLRFLAPTFDLRGAIISPEDETRKFCSPEISRQNTLYSEEAHSFPRYKVAIFSMTNDCDWLKEFLQKDVTISLDVDTTSIGKVQKMHSCELEKYAFAILYHTQKQGQLKTCDATGSVYDWVLEKIAHNIGRQNVIVVVDHVKGQEKNKILKEQPSISSWASDMILFGEKKDPKNLNRIKEIIEQSISYGNAKPLNSMELDEPAMRLSSEMSEGPNDSEEQDDDPETHMLVDKVPKSENRLTRLERKLKMHEDEKQEMEKKIQDMMETIQSKDLIIEVFQEIIKKLTTAANHQSETFNQETIRESIRKLLMEVTEQKMTS